MIKCYDCNGGYYECPVCHGTKKDPRNPEKKCGYCNGEGKKCCTTCNGKGVLPDEFANL